MSKKGLIILSSIIIFLTSIIVFYGVIKPNPVIPGNQEAKITNNDIKIAFVNEDSGVVYNGDNIQMSSVLLNTLKENTEYKLETVSRAIAEKGLEAGNYNIMLVLPSKFSQDVLALESRNPKQAIFQYKIKSDKKDIVKQAEQAVSEIKQFFNKDIINVYFSSIIGNLQSSQTQVGAAIGRERSVLNKYQSNLLVPLTDYSNQFKGVGSSSENMLSSFSNFHKSINNTNEAFTSIMDTNRTYDKEIEKIKLLQENWQSSLQIRENNLNLYDEGLKKLSVKEELSNLKLTQKFLSEELTNPVAYTESEQKVENLNKAIETILTTFNGMNSNVLEITNTYQDKIKEAVSDSMKKSAVDNANQQTIGLMIDDLKGSMLERVSEAVRNLPYYDANVIENLQIGEEDKKYLKNINSFAEKYSQANNIILAKNNTTFSQERLLNLKGVVLNELTKNRTISLRNNEDKYIRVRVLVNSPYKFNSLSVNYGSISKISDNEFIVTLNQPTKELNINYKLEYKGEVLMMSPAVVDAEIDTVRSVSMVHGEGEKIETTDKDGKKTSKLLYSKEDKDIKNKSTQTQVIFPFELPFNLKESNKAIYNDLKNYNNLFSVVKTIYGLDLNKDSFDSLEPKEGSLLKKAELKNLNEILTSIVAKTITNQLKTELTIPKEKFSEIEALKVNAEELNKVIGELRKNTKVFSDNLSATILETEKVSKTLEEKPELKETEKRDNTELVTVSLEINKDLIKLMGASNTLLNNTKSNQSTSEVVNKGFESLGNSVKTLERDGTGLASKVNDLKSSMNANYGDNEEFLKSFSKVLNNAKDGNSKNKAVYDYLSNPVNAGNITKLVSENNTQNIALKQDTRTGFVVIVVVYLISVLLAHILQNTDFSKIQNQRYVSRVQWKNASLPMTIMLGLSFVLSIIMGLIVGGKLDYVLEKTLGLIVLMFLLMVLFTGMNNWLLNKIKSTGLLISISILLLYLVTAGQLVDERTKANEVLSYISPLNYIENALTSFLNNQDGWGVVFGISFIFTILVSVLNMSEYKKIKNI